MTNGDVDHRGADRRGVGQGRRTGAAGDPGRAGGDREGVRGGRRERDPRAHPRRRGPADARSGPAAGDGAGAAGRDRPDRPALLGRRGHRSGGATGWPCSTPEPDMASCTMGTVNFGDDVFLNRWEFIVDLHTRMQERGIVPEYEIFDLGQLAVAAAAARPARPAGRRPRARRLRHGRARRHARHHRGAGRVQAGACATCPRARRSRPPASAAPRSPVLLASLSAGGHLRVGMEDTVTYAKGQPVESNTQLVARAVGVRPAGAAAADDHRRGARRCSAYAAARDAGHA